MFANPAQSVLAQISLVSGFRPPISRTTGRLNNVRKKSSNKSSAEAAIAVDICPQSFEVAVASIMENNPSFVDMIRACSVAKKPVSPLAQPRRAASFHTFAENKGEAPMAPPSESFSHPRGPVRFLVPRSTLCGQPSRGFKSRRAEDDGGYPFKTTTTAAINDYRYAGQKNNPTDSTFDNILGMDGFGRKDSKEKSSTKFDDKALLEMVTYKVGFQEGKHSKSKVEKFSSFMFTSILVGLTLYYVVYRPAVGGLLGNLSATEILPEDVDITFDDVRGCEEAKEELQEIVEFLMNPEKFSVLGGKLPKGCLLVGPPGTGKTLLAKAVAGQAGVPFFQTSGSEFEEVLVGQGARRVRDLFRVAKERAPCVVFIDEIDSVGSKRTYSQLHPYANQTINQLLSEMDGFVSNEGVIVLGATNRSEDLDKALLRPGRFDTQVVVPYPDIKGRKDILDLYVGQITAKDIDVDKLARLTTGFTGADLENMVNTAAIRAAIEGRPHVTMQDFEYSHDKHLFGKDWKSRVRDKEDLRITAYHEAGHTLVAYYTPNATPLHKVTIVAKGTTGGHTAYILEKDKTHYTKSDMITRMDTGMGGRAAEEILLGKENITGGASQDLKNATAIAEDMVKRLGMSEKLGLRVVREQEESLFGSPGGASELGPNTLEAVDAEIKVLLNSSYSRALKILQAHRTELDQLAEALLKYETLDLEDVKAIISGNADAVATKFASSSLLQKQQANEPKTEDTSVKPHPIPVEFPNPKVH